MTDDQRRVDARPTKDFFISMLVRDIELIPAITDLVDNSVDGARSLRGGGTLEGLGVQLSVEPDRFVITDNCGGIDSAIAEKYAFRFGRPDDFDPVEHGIGQFGVGMKRALFKLGKKFVVESVAARTRFKLTVDVEEWRDREEKDWTFQFDAPPEHLTENVPEAERGTTITVTELHSGVAADFADGEKIASLISDLGRRHQVAATKHLEMVVNGDVVPSQPAVFACSDAIQPMEKRLNGVGEVSVVLRTGIADSDGQAGGWSIFCNDRLILGADQTEITGWGWKDGETRVPKFHAQFARFRGYAFFEATDSGELPWNTTKTSVDTDSAAFRQAKREMLTLARPVINFLNDLSEEIGIADDGPLQSAVREADKNLLPFHEVEYADSFEAPKAELESEESATGGIQYGRPKDKIARLKEFFKVGTNREVGEQTFDRYYQEAFGDEDDENG